MDIHLKQWRNQQYESENQHQHPAKIPKLLSNNLNINETNNPQYQKPELPSGSSALTLFVPQPNTNTNTNKISTHLSSHSHPFPDHSISTTSRLPKMGSGYFSMAQRQELELQASILRYMSAGATVPAELLQPIKKSITLLTTPQYFLHQQHPHSLHQFYSYYQPASAALLQSGYWGRGAMDPEPGRCRRTDGKKWRCARDVVVGQKYCERHLHRGRNRSRKPVEIPTPAAGKLAGAAGGGGGGVVVSSSNAVSGGGSGGGAHFALTRPASAASSSSLSSAASIDLMRLSRSSSHVKRENKHIFESNDGAKSDGHVLRHFLDDWPISLQEPDNVGTTNNSSMTSMNSSTSLSISMWGQSPSDVSLKLSTGNGDGPGHAVETRAHLDRQSNWTTGYSSPMGGPLAEALRSSNSNSSPTSVLHQLPR